MDKPFINLLPYIMANKRDLPTIIVELRKEFWSEKVSWLLEYMSWTLSKQYDTEEEELELTNNLDDFLGGTLDI